MTALLGHLMEIEFTPEFKRWDNSTTKHLFNAQVIKKVKNDMTKLEENIKRLARYSAMLVIWTDCDRYRTLTSEGENIGAEVVEICRQANPSIIVKRARFSVIQQREIRQAWHNLGELDMKQAEAVDARSELDLRIGAAFTRFQTVNLKHRFFDLQDQKVLSYGTCQFPTLGFVVDRYNRVKEFVQEAFYKIDATISKDGINTKFSWVNID